MPRVQGKLICLGTQFRSHQCRRVYLAKTLTQGRPSQNRTEPSTERMYAMQFRAAFGRFQTPRSKPAFHPSLVAGTARKTFMSLVRLQQVPDKHQAPLIGKSEKRAKACTIIYGGDQIFKSCSAKGRARARVGCSACCAILMDLGEQLCACESPARDVVNRKSIKLSDDRRAHEFRIKLETLFACITIHSPALCLVFLLRKHTSGLNCYICFTKLCFSSSVEGNAATKKKTSQKEATLFSRETKPNK